jgi:L-methionine (R)-S-oxide reductase
MFHLPEGTTFANKSEHYAHVLKLLSGLLEGESDFLANLANTSSLLFHLLPELNWCGCYLLRGSELVLGPFQGKPACTRIPLGKGVCGTAGARKQTVVVENVNEFPGHIACDAASASEIVVPMLRGGELIGVLDLDSPLVGRFDTEDQKGLEAVVQLLLKSSGPAKSL